jgi:Helix-turn-helix domain
MSHDGYSHIGISSLGLIMLPLDPHVVDALLPDLVGHDKRPSSFVLYLWLYSMTKGVSRKSAFFSYQMLTDRTGLSKRAVQRAVAHLQRRQLIRVVRKSATAVPEYAVATPWIHPETSGGRR